MQTYKATEAGLATLGEGTTGALKQARDESPPSNRGGPSYGEDTGAFKQYTFPGL
jgi:hypothetical protein